MAITKISWNKAVTTAGTALAGPDTGAGTFAVQADPANTGTYMYIGNDGADDVASTTGYALKKDLNPIIMSVSNMSQVFFDTDTSGDSVVILKLQSAQEGSSPAAT